MLGWQEGVTSLMGRMGRVLKDITCEKDPLMSGHSKMSQGELRDVMDQMNEDELREVTLWLRESTWP